MRCIRVRISGQLSHVGYAPEEQVVTQARQVRAGDLITVRRRSPHGQPCHGVSGTWGPEVTYEVAGTEQCALGFDILLLQLRGEQLLNAAGRERHDLSRFTLHLAQA